MKKSIFYFTLISLAIVLSSCSSDNNDEEMQTSSQSVEAVSNLVVSGSWTITSYVDSGTDETSDYSGYSFSFNTDGSLEAVNGTTVITGSWSVTNDDNSDDDDYDSMDDVDFNIFFSAPPAFEELTDDWDIASRSSNRIELIDISGGDGSTDTLVFEKN
ncbi:hypothetical protein [Muriicola soli]|uniref:Lipocalin-like domain-containing protein n=1 Tax=Muriicola soli TaxID=2507538 RepID=A0A411EAS8_9FLAO|nr:hypothetical protein [Muriicola soli]QBA64758.1 hypothetical protein EQY75_09605 [Muriicola soli]